MSKKVASSSKSGNSSEIVQACEIVKSSGAIQDKPVHKVDALLIIWSHAMKGEVEREEIFKTAVLPNIQQLLDKGTVEDKFGAIGALSALAVSEKHVAELVTNKIITLAAAMLVGDHARCKCPAANLLSLLAYRPEYSNKVADIALIPLARALMDKGPGWAQALQIQLICATTLKTLIENVQGDNSEVKQARRVALVNIGLVPWLSQLISCTPSMPKPIQYPAPYPQGKGTTGGGKGKSDKIFPQGKRQAIATASAACLRFLALCPGFVDQLLGSGCLQGLIDALVTSSDSQAAYLCGILWEICSDASVALQVLKCGAVPALLHVLSKNLAGALPKKGSKKGAKKATNAPVVKKADSNDPVINYNELAVCNASGALHHLSFLDEAKVEIADPKNGGSAMLIACLRCQEITYENASGTLWNLGTDVASAELMKESQAPDYLAQPVPFTWLTNASEEIDE